MSSKMAPKLTDRATTLLSDLKLSDQQPASDLDPPKFQAPPKSLGIPGILRSDRGSGQAEG